MKITILIAFIIPTIVFAQKVKSMSPSWSPDGQWIAYYSNRDGNNEIYITDVKGSEHKRITYNGVKDYLPKFSSDGKRLVFFSNENGNYQIFIIDIDGSNRKLITNSKANHEDLNWLRDGSIILPGFKTTH